MKLRELLAKAARMPLDAEVNVSLPDEICPIADIRESDPAGIIIIELENTTPAYLDDDDRREPHEDTPCLEDGVDNCNDSGTGEGRYHGRI
jgi:hypothetical protein